MLIKYISELCESVNVTVNVCHYTSIRVGSIIMIHRPSWGQCPVSTKTIVKTMQKIVHGVDRENIFKRADKVVIIHWGLDVWTS